MRSLRDRFSRLLGVALPFTNGASARPDLQFTSNVLLMAPVLDPAYAFNWLQDHPGSDEEKEALRQKIIGKFVSCAIIFIVSGLLHLIHIKLAKLTVIRKLIISFVLHILKELVLILL